MKAFSVRWLLIALILLFSGAGLYYLFTTPGLKPVVISIYEPAIVEPDEKTHDLGVIQTDSKAFHTFHLYNVGGKPLVIKNVETSCGCTVAAISRKRISPGDVADLKVSLDTSIKLGKVKKKITVHTNDPKQPELKLFLTANVVAQMKGHEKIAVKDPLVLFKGECATCHVNAGKGKTGKSLFLADCAMCHGQNGQGSVAKSLIDGNYDDPQYAALMRKIIAEGSPRTPEMPPFSQAKGGPLNDGEIDSLVNFLRFQSSQAKAGLLDQPTPEDEEE